MNLHSHPYEAYRASNSEWVNQTPSEWEEKRVKDLFRLVTEKAPVDNDHELLSLYASIGVRPRKDLEARGNKASSTDGYWVVKKGDIVVNKLLAWMGSVGLSEYDGVTSPAYDVLRKTSKLIDVRYFSYLFRTEIAKQIFKRNSRGIMDMRLRLYFDKLGAITVPVPPFSTQQAIATYIDTKTAQIDRQIDLLGQKASYYGKLKQSLINETVTYGLNKSTPMKNSGVEGIGKVPEHWIICRLKDKATFNPSKTEIKERPRDCTFAPMEKLKTDLLLTDTTTITIDVSGSYTYFREGDVLIAKVTPCFENRNIAIAKNLTNGIGFGSSEINVVRASRKTNTRWLFYLFLSSRFIETGASKMAGAGGLKRIPSLFLETFSFALPSFSEQTTIAAYLDINASKIDDIVTSISHKINRLKDLRKALINDVVTGKIKVVSEGGAV